jgi:hypothetical protein
MAVPASFAAFQKLFEDSTSLFPDQRKKDNLTAREKRTGPEEEEIPDEETEHNPERQARVLSYAADAILADLHEQENLRDAVIDTLPNPKNNTLLFVVNPTLEATEELIDFLSEHPRIKKFALGARKLTDGERVRAVKIKVIEVDDECDSPDKEGEEEKEKEQDQMKSLDNGDGSDMALNSGFHISR